VIASVMNSPLARLTPISLDELIDRAALQSRVDRKYVLPVNEARMVLSRVSSDTRVLEIGGARSFAYESLYFDTPQLASYLLAARRRRRRFKVRTRTYLDSALSWLEVKTRGPRGSTVKHRLPCQPGDRSILSSQRRFVDGVLSQESISGGCDMSFSPVLTTRYRRSTLFIPQTSSRATIDTDLMWDDDSHRLWLPGRVIVETKTGSVPSCVDRLLWERGFRPVRISKYATGLAALRPELPATPWRRTLSRYFSPVPTASTVLELMPDLTPRQRPNTTRRCTDDTKTPPLQDSVSAA
jgi:hypothetical protein